MIASAACTAELGMGERATASSPMIAAKARPIGVSTGSRCSRFITGGTGGSTRPTMR